MIQILRVRSMRTIGDRNVECLTTEDEFWGVRGRVYSSQLKIAQLSAFSKRVNDFSKTCVFLESVDITLCGPNNTFCMWDLRQ